ncbi:MAG TPA: hypothetical protein VEZ70_09420 [Allosphingosinicella sp.]|nr:hypothetical protein [Allosphingosinicella sp.]
MNSQILVALLLGSAPPEPAAPDLDALMSRALATAEPLLARVDWDTRAYRITNLVRAGRCDAELSLAEPDQEMRSERLQAAMLEAVHLNNTACAKRLARLSYSRRDDPVYTLAGRQALGLLAGAVLRAAGEETEGQRLVAEAEAALAAPTGAGGDLNALWRTRLRVLHLYEGTPLFAPELERAVSLFAGINGTGIDTSTANGFLTLLTREGRRGDAERLMRAVPQAVQDHDELARWVPRMLPARCPPPADAHEVVDAGIAAALAEQTDTMRLTRLEWIVQAAAWIKACKGDRANPKA